MTNVSHFDVAIIGGGAAGMMAAASALELDDGTTVGLFEKNKILGQKVLISGGGRCNVTTGLSTIKELLKRYPRGSRFLQYAFYEFGPAQVIEWFESHGVPLKTEEDLRVFPVSDNGHDVVGAFENIFDSAGDNFSLMLETDIVDIAHDANAEYPFTLKEKNGEQYGAKKVILTTGGQAYRATGSTGDGYAFAKKLGHTITPLGPSLNSFFVQESWAKNCSGVSIEKAHLSLKGKNSEEGKATVWDFTGAFVFTHKGVSGPAIFALSSFAAFEKITASEPLTLTVDFMPDENNEQFRARLMDLLEKHPKKNIENLIDMVLPKSLALAAIDFSGVDGEKHCAQISKEILNALIAFMKSARLTVIGRGAGEEFVTAGGVSTDEVDQKTMQSKICPGLFFAGEILNIDGFTGGFNLQGSWASGRLAGKPS